MSREPQVNACPAGHDEDRIHTVRAIETGAFYCRCDVCDWGGPPRSTREGAVAAWNRRSSIPAAMVRELREAQKAYAQAIDFDGCSSIGIMDRKKVTEAAIDAALAELEVKP